MTYSEFCLACSPSALRTDKRPRLQKDTCGQLNGGLRRIPLEGRVRGLRQVTDYSFGLMPLNVWKQLTSGPTAALAE